MIQLASKAPIMLMFAGVIVKIFNNRLALQCSSVCRWYINPLLPETTLLQQSYGAVAEPPHHIGEERKSEHQATTVKELAKLKNPHEVQGNKYVVVAKIKELQPDQPWWYMACTTCKSGTKFDGQRYTCRNSTCNSTGGIERYRITFLTEDPDSIDSSEEEMVEIICFSPLGDELTGITADKLVNATSRVQGFVPEQLTRLLWPEI